MKPIFGLCLVLLLTGPLCAHEDVPVTVHWLTSSTAETPRLSLVIENRTNGPVSVQGYHGKPMVSLDFWYDFEGLVLMDADQYRVTMGGFAVLEPVTIAPGKSVSVELDLSTFVALAGESRGTNKWLEDFANAQGPRVVARVKIDGVERFSKYAFLKHVDLQAPSIAPAASSKTEPKAPH
jgi:hypothetical protein